MRLARPLLLLTAATCLLPVVLTAATLRSFGAKGDGMTDDRAALERALKESAGQPLDGEGLVYAVNGNVTVKGPVDLRRLTLRQIAPSFDTSPYICSTLVKSAPQVQPAEALTRMVQGLPLLRHDGIATYAEDPTVPEAEREPLRRMLNLRTLFIAGQDDKPVSVTLEDVKIDRGQHAEVGMHSNAAGLYLVNISPLKLKRVEVFGDGKGAGILVNRCRQVRLDEVFIHDLRWAPYRGDVDFSATLLGGADFGWNNSPIYDYDDRHARFIRVRVQEQLVGLVLTLSEDVEIQNTRVARIGALIEGQFLPWQADGLTVSAVKNFTMRDSVVSQAWEGIDFTGRGVDGFLQENIRISDCFSYSFKYAHPQRNGKVIRCVSERADYKAFIIGSECENIEFIDCAALETGSVGRWRRPGRPRNGIAAFEVDFDAEHTPHAITLRDCRAENVQFPTLEYGFLSSDRARDPAHRIQLIRPRTTGASLRAIDGFSVP